MTSSGRGTRLKIAILLPTLEMGGAERQSIELANRLDRTKFDVTLIALSHQGNLAAFLYNVPLQVIRGDYAIATFFDLLRVARKFDIAQSYLLKTNLYLLLIKPFAPRLKIVTGLRDSVRDRSRFYTSTSARRKEALLNRLVRLLSPLGATRISNSQAGLKLLKRKTAVIPNGIDTQKFTPDPAARKRLRQLIGADESAPVIGMVANCTVYKNYPNFVRAASSVIREVPEAQFLSIGQNRTSEGASAAQLAKELGLESSMHFLGCRFDVEKLIPGMDVFCSSSATEGFSNAISEAMSCGVPCVVTDVGDSALIVGETGIVVKPGSSEELGAAITRILRLPLHEREKLKVAARQRIVANFGMTLMVSQYEDLYRGLIVGREKSPHASVAKTPAA